jgi:hypothetical protein
MPPLPTAEVPENKTRELFSTLQRFSENRLLWHKDLRPQSGCFHEKSSKHGLRRKARQLGLEIIEKTSGSAATAVAAAEQE